MRIQPHRKGAVVVLAAVCALATACERPPVEVEQRGYPGVALQTLENPRSVPAKLAANQAPAPLPPVDPTDKRSDEIYQNVEVLGDVDAAEFTRLMGAITTWVSADEGCNYCHAGGNFAAEGIYTKTVARRMIQMTQRINRDWKAHVGETGVTCYTCHRTNPVPERIWYHEPPDTRFAGFAGWTAGQNRPATEIGLTSLPFDPFSLYLGDDDGEIRIQSATALPTGTPTKIKDAEKTYALMVHTSQSLGVNCTYCHNSRAFMPWEESSPARVKAWHAIRMVREINEEYIGSLAHVFPENRKGPEGDVYKVHCGTCHAGLPKPLGGEQMVADYPALAR